MQYGRCVTTYVYDDKAHGVASKFSPVSDGRMAVLTLPCILIFLMKTPVAPFTNMF